MTAPIFQSRDAKAVRSALDRAAPGACVVDEIHVEGVRTTVATRTDFRLKDEQAVATECLRIYDTGKSVSGQRLRVMVQGAGVTAYLDWELESAAMDGLGGVSVVAVWDAEVNPYSLFPRYGKYLVPFEESPDETRAEAWRKATLLADSLNSRSEYGELLRWLDEGKRRT